MPQVWFPPALTTRQSELPTSAGEAAADPGAEVGQPSRPPTAKATATDRTHRPIAARRYSGQAQTWTGKGWLVSVWSSPSWHDTSEPQQYRRRLVMSEQLWTPPTSTPTQSVAPPAT